MCTTVPVKFYTYRYVGVVNDINGHVQEQILEQMPLGCLQARYAHLVCNSRGQAGHLQCVTDTLW
jgi:hypothetical protein